jgi:hypothetical protein
MEWLDLFFPLLGVLLGGGIATATQWSLSRSEADREDRKELRRAAADLVGTYGLAWSTLIGARKNGDSMPSDDDLGYAERNIKYSYFAMCPGAETHLAAVEENRLALKDLVAALDADDETWKRAQGKMLEAQQSAQSSLRSN